MVYCVFVGGFKDKRLRQLAGEFNQRLQRLWPVTVVEIPGKDKDILGFIRRKEGKGLLISLDAHGKSMDSNAFGKWVTQSPRDFYFFAWGAEGPPKTVGGAMGPSLSLSPMTYSHEMARILLMEQLYRAGAALRGHPYPK